jgi:MarR family transcriptional regulator, lower aerobic nicotinate degradation pathway regulator
VVDALAQLSFAVQTTLGRIAATHGVSIVQARLLGILRDRRPTIKELAGFLQLDKSSVTGLVDRAADSGLVRRVPSTLDRRNVQVVITAAGRALVDLAASDFASELEVLLVELSSSERHRLSVLASRVVTTEARRRGINLAVIDQGS